MNWLIYMMPATRGDAQPDTSSYLARLCGRILLGLFFVVLSGQLGRSQNDSSNSGHWTLDNGLVSREISFDAKAGFVTGHWRNLQSKKEFIDPELASFNDYCHEFRFVANGRSYTGTGEAFSLIHADESTDSSGGHNLDLTLASSDGDVTVTLHYIQPAQSTAIRQFLTIRNNLKQTITLSHVSIACEQLEPAKPVNLLAYGGYGEDPQEMFFTGRTDDVAILLEDAISGEGVAAMSEVPGILKRTEVGVIGKWHQWEPGVQVMYDTDLFPFERSLGPGEQFNTAAVSFLLYRRGTSQDPHWLIPQYVLRNIARSTPSGAPRWMYNSWEPWGGKIASAELARVEQAVAESGFGIFVIDDGWQQKRGDNATDPVRFSDGLTPETEVAKKTGMQLGLWFPMADVNQDSPVYQQHPEWACRDKDGKIRHMAGLVQMNMASPYQYEAVERLSQAIRQYDLKYVKLDLTTAFNTYGEEPGCYGPGGESQISSADRESIPRIYEALEYVATQLHSRFPDLLIDYTFELWGDKHLIDYGLLREADLDWISNVADRIPTDAGPRAARMLLYRSGMAIPAETMLIGNMQGEAGSWQVRAATEMGSYPLMLGDFSKISPEDRAHYADWIARFRALRARVPLNESFFPLGSWRQPRGNQWDGFARLSAAGEGVIVLFRNDSENASAHLQIPGFPDGSITAHSWTTNEEFSWTGEELRRGRDIPLGEKEVIVLELSRNK